MNISYNLKKNEFKVTGNVNKVGQDTLVEAILRNQIGKGVDNRKPNKREVYNIRIEADLSYDDIKISDNTGNKGLRDGILMDFYSRLKK